MAHQTSVPPMCLHDPDSGESILLAPSEESALAEARRCAPLDPIERVDPEGWMADVGWDRDTYERKRDFEDATGLTSWWMDCLPPGDGVATKKRMPAWSVVYAEEHRDGCCDGCGDLDPAHPRNGGWYCEGCASCAVCQSPYCENEDHDV